MRIPSTEKAAIHAYKRGNNKSEKVVETHVVKTLRDKADERGKGEERERRRERGDEREREREREYGQTG